ncbi:hypothetical protein L3X38_036766 [Prunus dulcis]|uniref:Uncharacterized protein n=1 Tax=Prunus dulcis TaxID=3755 RepID=A0AAD4V3C8_PRUDU|nr:hypothetical protein L3X38_036766 [Prunus dulcis]
MQLVLIQVARVKPHLAPACQSLEHWLSKTLRHISMIREILHPTVDLEEVFEDNYDSKTRYLELIEATEDILDKLEELEGQEEELRADIAADLDLKAKLDEKLEESRARIAASKPAIQDLTSRTFQARLANKKATSMHKALSLELDNVTDLISIVLEYIS